MKKDNHRQETFDITMTSVNTTTTAAKANSNWLLWFKSRDSAIQVNKQHQDTLIKTFDASIDPDTILGVVAKHEETVFLHKVNVGTSRIALFHHLTEVGGTVYDAGAKDYGFIQNVGEDSAIRMTPDPEGLSRVEVATAAPVPTVNQIFGITKVEDITSMTESATTITYKPRNFMPIPPFLLDTIHEAISKCNGDANAALIKCIAAIKQFDSDHASDTAYTEKAKIVCKPVALWLYLVCKDSPSIAAINTIGCNNSKVIQALVDATTNKLAVSAPTPSSISQQMESSLKRPFEVLAATSSTTSEFMEKLTQLHSQNQDKASKTFKKIPAKYQQMILVASSVGDITEVDYTADATEFFKCTTTLHAQVMLNSLFEVAGIDCSVSAAVATSLLYGSFLWRNALSPSGLAASVLSSEGLLRNDTLQEGLVLDYATKFDISAASLSKLTKTQVLYPVDIEDLTHRMRGLQTLAAFFFKPRGYMSQGLKQIVHYCMDHRRILRTRIHIDKEFIAKFVCAVDERVYNWLRECSVHQIVSDTTLQLMDFTYLLQDITFNRFVFTLPPSVATVENRGQDKGGKPGAQESARDKAPRHLRNPSLQKEWKLRNDESWSSTFRNQTINGPMLSINCHPCLKYHVRGACFADCRNKASHCTLVGKDKDRVTKFLKSLRGE